MSLRDEIRRFVADNFLFGQEGAVFADEASFLEKGLIDSTGVLELVAFVEEKYGFKVADEELVPENFDTVGNLAAYIARRAGRES